VDKPPFKPLPPKEGNEEKEEKKKKKKGTKKKKKKKKKENKKKEVTAYPRVNEITLSNRKYVAPNDYCDNESKYDDLPMPFTYIRDHYLNEHTTFDIANLWETNSENDDDNNCHSVSAIHASSHNDIESSKLGEEVFENPFATDHYVFDTSPSNNNDGMVIDKPTVKDNYSISYDDTVPPIFDDYYKECYDIGYNYPYETCHSHDWITKNNSFNMQLVYHVQILDNNLAPITINEKNSSYAKINDTSMHMNHDKNVLSDGYIVDFINDATESYYERGKYGYMHLNNIKFPLFMLRILKFRLCYFSMLVALCLHDLFIYKIPFHRKHGRLKFVLNLPLDALFCFKYYFLRVHH
jgi:hypothetical protein